jgi:hypothetical protein
MEMGLWNACAFVKLDERNRGTSLFASPEHLFVNTLKRFFAPWH